MENTSDLVSAGELNQSQRNTRSSGTRQVKPEGIKHGRRSSKDGIANHEQSATQTTSAASLVKTSHGDEEIPSSRFEEKDDKSVSENKLKSSVENVPIDTDWENLDETTPFLGFNDQEKEKPLLETIEQKSALLFEYITNLKKLAYVNSVAAIAASNKGKSIAVPLTALQIAVEPLPKIRIVRASEGSENLQQMLEWLQTPFEAGWKRELLYKSIIDARAHVVQYVSPDGTVVKNEDELMDYLENIYGLCESDGGLSKKNFSFYKSPLAKLGENARELLYVVDRKGGKALINTRKRPSSPGKIGQQRLPFAKPQQLQNKKGRIEVATSRPLGVGMKRSEQKTVLIPRKIPMGNRVMPTGSFVKNEGINNRRPVDRRPPTNEMMLSQKSHRVRPQAISSRQGPVLPCSIRCPGRPGEVPNLQCKRCLCLYHAICLGLSSNANFGNFICPNCETKSGGGEASNTHNRQIARAQMGRTSDGVAYPQRIGQTVIIPEFQPIGKGSGNANVRTVGPSYSNVRGGIGNRGQARFVGRFPTVPQLSSTSGFAVPPLKASRSGIGVPTLRPMVSSTGNIRARSMAIPNLHPATPGKAIMPKGKLPIYPTKKMVPLRPVMRASQVPDPTQLRSPPPPSTAVGQNGIRVTHFRRWPQSVIAIGGKKFIAMPMGDFGNNNSPVRNGNAIDMPPTRAISTEAVIGAEPVVAKNTKEVTMGNSVGFHNEKKVLAKVLPYLSVRDLLSASCVNKAWNSVACEKDLWKVVRMKNANVFDFESFVYFLKKQGTEVVDLRKMMGSTDWQILTESLGKVSELKQIIVGPRCSSPRHMELLSKNCPNVQVTAQ